MSLTAEQKFKVKKFLKDLASHKGRHTELVSVYIPAGYELTKIIQKNSRTWFSCIFR